MASNKGGRPEKLTAKIQSVICEALRDGNYYEAACAKAGIGYKTFRNWMRRGQAALSGRFFQFFHAVKQAQSQAETEIVAQWRAQIPENWQAARDFLARRFPDRWGQKDKHEHSGDDRRPIRFEFTEPQSPSFTSNGSDH